MQIDHLRTAIAEQVPRLQKWEVDGLAKKLEREGLLSPEWIPVAERMPEESGHSYLTCSTTGHIAVRWLGKIGWDSDLMSSDKITHWQPLPEGPHA